MKDIEEIPGLTAETPDQPAPPEPGTAEPGYPKPRESAEVIAINGLIRLQGGVRYVLPTEVDQEAILGRIEDVIREYGPGMAPYIIGHALGTMNLIPRDFGRMVSLMHKTAHKGRFTRKLVLKGEIRRSIFDLPAEPSETELDPEDSDTPEALVARPTPPRRSHQPLSEVERMMKEAGIHPANRPPQKRRPRNRKAK